MRGTGIVSPPHELNVFYLFVCLFSFTVMLCNCSGCCVPFTLLKMVYVFLFVCLFFNLINIKILKAYCGIIKIVIIIISVIIVFVVIKLSIQPFSSKRFKVYGWLESVLKIFPEKQMFSCVFCLCFLRRIQ